MREYIVIDVHLAQKHLLYAVFVMNNSHLFYLKIKSSLENETRQKFTMLYDSPEEK